MGEVLAKHVIAVALFFVAHNMVEQKLEFCEKGTVIYQILVPSVVL